MEDYKHFTIKQLQDKIEELTKEFEKNKNKLVLAYKKMDELSIEYEKVNNELKSRKS